MGFFSDTWKYLRVNHEAVLEALRMHVWLALLPVLIAIVASLPLGWAISRFHRFKHILLTLSSVVYTIPSLALLLVLPAVLGTGVLDATNVVVALAIYTTALLMRTTADGLASVDPAVIQAANAMGYKPARRWFTVELPLALPVIFAGIRVGTVASVSMVSIAALIGIGGLGQLFTRGFQLGFYLPPIVTGLVLSVALAIVCDMLVVLLQRALTPWTRVAAR